MTADRQHLQTTIRQVRRRFKSIASIRGLAWWLGLSLLAVAAAVTAVDTWNYGQRVLVLARWTSLLVIGLSLAWLVVRPLVRRISDVRIARTIEERYPHLPVVLMTAYFYDKDHVIKRSRLEGLEDVLFKKPVDPDRLKEMILKLCKPEEASQA